MGQPEDKVWNALFWVIQLFVCINAIAKSFLQDSKGRMLYFFSIAGPIDYIISKLIFNAILMLLMNLLSLAIFTLLLGNPITKMGEFVLISFIGGMSLSLVFTF